MKTIDHNRIVALATMKMLNARDTFNHANDKAADAERVANRAEATYNAKMAILREAERAQRDSQIEYCETKDGDYKYTIEGDAATITEYTGKGGEVVVPDTLGGCPVTSIGNGAFYECFSLISIALPKSVVTIGRYAFGDCGGLISITLPDGLTGIGDGAFSSCFGLASIDLPKGITAISGGAFYRCKSLTSVIVPKSVTTIGDGAFWDCTGLTIVILPDGITTIGEDSFLGCTGLAAKKKEKK